MRAWLMDSYAGVDALRLGEVPDPQPGPGEVVLEMTTAALNPADAFLAQGRYPARPQMPHVLGRDGVGVVAAASPGVTHLRIGDKTGILRCNAGVDVWGTLAEKVAVPAESVVHVPAGWSSDEMAGGPLALLTAWQALTQWEVPPAPPPEASVVLITGATGGVGVASILLARTMGLTIVALSRSAAKAARLREIGAHFTFDPSDRDLKAHVKAAVGERRIDLVIDNVAGPLFPDLVAMLAYRGRVSVVGRSGGDVPAFNTGTLFFRRNRIGGVAVGDYTPASAQAAWQEIVNRLAETGGRPLVDSAFPFDDVKAAFKRLGEGPLGKVLVRLRTS